MPEYSQKDKLSTWIDENISAEFLDIDGTSSTEDIQYNKMIESYMIHKCSSGTVNSCLDSDGQCSKHYTTNKIQSKTTFDERGFPEYKRRTTKSLKVVPHNRKILIDWNGHANVEFAGSTFLVLYLYKVTFFFVFNEYIIYINLYSMFF